MWIFYKYRKERAYVFIFYLFEDFCSRKMFHFWAIFRRLVFHFIWKLIQIHWYREISPPDLYIYMHKMPVIIFFHQTFRIFFIYFGVFQLLKYIPKVNMTSNDALCFILMKNLKNFLESRHRTKFRQNWLA